MMLSQIGELFNGLNLYLNALNSELNFLENAIFSREFLIFFVLSYAKAAVRLAGELGHEQERSQGHLKRLMYRIFVGTKLIEAFLLPDFYLNDHIQ